MPATHAAAMAALRELREFPIASVLDIGAGTGAASLAARQWFPNAAVTMVERDAALADAARSWLPDAAIMTEDVRKMTALPPHDLLVASYSLSEIGERATPRLWNASREALVAIEPGTPAGYSLILRVRGTLLAAGAHLVAPCPAETACPMAVPDWCHFAVRVERSSWHRRIKHAGLGYEDEKLSYVALARQPVPLATALVIRWPRQAPGLIVLETCTAAGLRKERVTRRDRAAFRAARQAAWGGRWSTV